MDITRTFAAPDRAAWRTWLAGHASTDAEIWLVYFKKHTGKPTVSYLDSLEEALCFGWVDSLIQKIDDDRYARKFTPRRIGSKWSEVNQRLVAKLIREGLMTEAGLARVDFSLPEGEPIRQRPAETPTPGWLKTGLRTSPLAWENFEKLPPRTSGVTLSGSRTPNGTRRARSASGKRLRCSKGINAWGSVRARLENETGES